jgi:hypothetical protein
LVRPAGGWRRRSGSTCSRRPSTAAGERLGPVGGRLVGEVLVGIVDADAESYRAVDPGWRPTLPAAQAGRFGLADLLAFSAVVAGAEA